MFALFLCSTFSAQIHFLCRITSNPGLTKFRKVAFDPTLDPVRVDKMPVSGVLYNTGQSLVFRADTDRLSMMPINMTGGPFSYRQASME